MTDQDNPEFSKVHSQLEDVSRSLRDIASNLKSNHDKKAKDKWDKFNAFSPFVTALVVAVVGGLFTINQDYHNEILKEHEMEDSKRQAAQDAIRKNQEAHILELQTIAQLMPYLTSKNENSKQVAITAINELASTQLAVELARLNKSPGTINAIRQIASQSGKEVDRKFAQAALVELESSATGPNKTVLKTEEGDCGPEGMGGDKATNLLKNRTDVPTAYRDVVAHDMAQMQNVDVPSQRDSWTQDDIQKVTREGEGSGVRLQGYLIAVKREGGTSANCKIRQLYRLASDSGTIP
jgi:hypothetical protein